MDCLKVDVKMLPEYESLQMVTRIAQVVTKPSSFFDRIAVSDLREAVLAYQFAKSMKQFLKEWKLEESPKIFGRQLPSVRYQLWPCECGNRSYLRRISTRSDFVHRRRGSLECERCPAFYFYSNVHRVWMRGGVATFQERNRCHGGLSVESSDLGPIANLRVRELLVQVMQAYVPENKFHAIDGLLNGVIDIDEAQDRVGIYLS